MALNLEVNVVENLNNCAISYKDELVNVQSNVNSDVDSGEMISLASRRQERRRSSSTGASPTIGTTARISYTLDMFNKNAMLIIHNNYYKGSDETAGKVKTTFEKYRFEVEVLSNRNGEEIKHALDRFFDRDFTEYGSVGIVVISPTVANGTYKAKKKCFTNYDILRYFQKGEVPTLKGKPKILISEANKLFKYSYIKSYSKTRDVVDIRLLKRTDRTKTYRRSGITNPHLLREFCDKLEQNTESYDFLNIAHMIGKRTTYIGDRSSPNDKPAHTIMTSLTKELWLWKTGG